MASTASSVENKETVAGSTTPATPPVKITPVIEGEEATPAVRPTVEADVSPEELPEEKALKEFWATMKARISQIGASIKGFTQSLASKWQFFLWSIVAILLIIFEWEFLISLWQVLKGNPTAGFTILVLILGFLIIIWTEKISWLKNIAVLLIAIAAYRFVAAMVLKVPSAFFNYDLDLNSKLVTNWSQLVAFAALFFGMRQIGRFVRTVSDIVGMVAVIAVATVFYIAIFNAGWVPEWMPDPSGLVDLWKNIQPQLAELNFRWPFQF